MRRSEPSATISLSYRLGLSDLVRALRFHDGRPCALTMFGWAVTLAVLGILLERGHSAAWVVSGAFALASVVAVVAIAWPLCTAWRWHKRHGAFAATEMTVREQGIQFRGGMDDGEVAWSQFERYAIRPQLFLLYRSPKEFLMVPSRAFKTGAELARFKSVLQTHLGDPCRPAPEGAAWL